MSEWSSSPMINQSGHTTTLTIHMGESQVGQERQLFKITVKVELTVEAVDTTGAGDAFVGGLSAGIVTNPDDFKKAVNFANSVAALSVTKKGTAPAMPTLSEVQEKL